MPDPHPADDDPRLPALLAWRQQLIASGAASASSFKEAHIKMVLNSGRTDVKQIEAMLPGAVAAHAEEMARMIVQAADGAAPDSAHAERLANPAPSARSASTRPSVTHDQPTSDGAFSTDTFAPSVVTELPATVDPLVLRRHDDGGLAVSWASRGGAFVIYRVVCAEGDRPYAPDRAHLIAATTATFAVDGRPASSAVRHVQVWANVGTSRAEALAAQPILHAAGVMIGAVTDLTVREDSGRVIGQWKVFPGIRAVHIYRVPAEEAAAGGPQHRISVGEVNLSGFIDSTAQPGRSYVYQFRTEAAVDAAASLSEAVKVELTVSAVLAPVTDLALTTHPGDHPRLELSWTTPPAGDVMIFRTKTAPAAGADAAELPQAALEQAGLGAEQHLAHPVSTQLDPHGTSVTVMADVAWPADWSRAYFTPVTVLLGRALLGRTTSSVRTGPVKDADLAEYCNKQVLTFAWPSGAAAVMVHLAPKDHDPREGLSGRTYEISLEEYEKYGGMQFVDELPAAGCSLHLTPLAFAAGKRVQGPITSILYPGLLRVQYAVQVTRDTDGTAVSARIAARALADLQGSPPFRLIHHPERIPLSVNDGDAVNVAPLKASGELAAGWSKVLQFSSLGTTGAGEMWSADVAGRSGWIRLFADLSDADRLRQLALLDPPVATLCLQEARQ